MKLVIIDDNGNTQEFHDAEIPAINRVSRGIHNFVIPCDCCNQLVLCKHIIKDGHQRVCSRCLIKEEKRR